MITINKVLAKDENGKIILINIKIYNKATNGVLMELEMPIDKEAKNTYWEGNKE